MPVRIEDLRRNRETIAYLCEDEWTIAPQLAQLERWLNDHIAGLVVGEYVADVGFSTVTPGASGGGAVVSTSMMKQMSAVGMELWISEYDGGSQGDVTPRG